MSALASCVFFRVREALVLSPRGREGQERVGERKKKITDNSVRLKVSCIAKITQKEKTFGGRWGKIYVKL